MGVEERNTVHHSQGSVNAYELRQGWKPRLRHDIDTSFLALVKIEISGIEFFLEPYREPSILAAFLAKPCFDNPHSPKSGLKDGTLSQLPIDSSNCLICE